MSPEGRSVLSRIQRITRDYCNLCMKLVCVCVCVAAVATSLITAFHLQVQSIRISRGGLWFIESRPFYLNRMSECRAMVSFINILYLTGTFPS